MTPAGINQGQQVLELRDVHLPPPPNWWPPAPGWWLLGAVLVVLVVALLIRLRSSLRRRARKREILSRLATLEREFNPERTPHFLTEVSILLRRVAVLQHPRREVASLSGEAWLRFLDETGGDGFLHGAGRVLGEGPYRRNTEADPAAIISLAKEWIVQNLRQGRRQ